MYRFSVTAGCACPFFIEIIEIIEIFAAYYGRKQKKLKKVGFYTCFFSIFEYK